MSARTPDALLAQVNPAPREGVLTIDLRDIAWVPPAVMVATAAQAHRARRAGEDVVVLGPTRAEPAGYAARMRLGRVLTDLGVTHDLPTSGRERDQSEHLIEVTEIGDDAAAARLSSLVFRKVREVDDELARALHRSVGEISANVPDHAETIGFLAAQTLPRRRELLLAVGDAGVGMRATLAHRGARSHEHAIELATTDEVSQYDEPERGAGLPTALRLIGAQHGVLYIATGTASIRHFPTTRRYAQSETAYQGSIVEARIRLG